MDVDDAAGANVEELKTWTCFDLKKAGLWDRVDRGRGPCGSCSTAVSRGMETFPPKWTCLKKTAATGKRGTRDREERGATEKRIQDEQVKACNLVMDEKTGLRPDGDTCWNCWRAVYHEDGCHKVHADIGPDATPFNRCSRTQYGKPCSFFVETALLKLKKLEASRAAGNC